MKNKTPGWLEEASSLASRSVQICFPMLRGIQEDDFLSGKTPKDLEFTLEEEE